jgi:hypothetical protein
MALEAGDAEAGTGLAGVMAEKMSEAFGKDFKVKDSAKGLNAMAAAIVEYILDNLEVDTSSNPGGLS